MQPWSLARVGIGVTLGVVVVLLLLWALQRHLIYFPIAELPPRPSEARAARFTTADGLELGGWFFPADDAEGRAIVVFNGNAGNRGHRVSLATALRDRGWSVLLTDYRGYGGNPGGPTEEGLMLDAEAAMGWLTAQEEVDPDRTAYFGESLGAGVAAGLTAERPPAALVLRSPFISLADVGATHYPFLPVRTLLWDRFPVLEHVREHEGPVLVIWGDADTIVPPAQSRAVAEAADARVLVIPGADHNDAALLHGATLIDAVVGFLEEHA